MNFKRFIEHQKRKVKINKHSPIWFYGFFCIFAMLIGASLNMIVILQNENKMPVASTWLNDKDKTYVLVDDNTNYVYLGDVFKIPLPNEKTYYHSIGDVFIYSGIFVFLLVIIRHRKSIIINIK